MTFGTFFLPGPTEVRPEILAAMQGPMIPHRGAQFEQLYARLQEGLRVVFDTQRPVYISTSSATGMMEAGIRCLTEGPILSLINGAFSHRFAEIAKACGRAVDLYEVPWGSAHDPEEVIKRARAKPYAAVTVVHSETSTGARNDIRAISDAAHTCGARCLVDSVSGLGGAELHADAWGLDYVLTGSQKALALPPGLAFAVASADFVANAKDVPGKGIYFDLVEMDAFARKNQTPSTPAVSLMYALERQLEFIVREGMTARWARHTAMAEYTYQWVDRMRAELGVDISILAPVGHRSPTVSTIMLPETIPGESLVNAVAERGFTIGTGYGKLKATAVRIGHMGDHTVDSVRACLEVCAEAVRTHR